MAEITAVDPTDPAEEGSDLRHLGRSALWAGLALSAMLVAILAARSETGLRRITIALNGMPGSAQVTPSGGEALASLPVRDLAIEAETRRLAESVRRLAAERERLVARLELLERSIDVTGALPPAASGRPPEAPASTTFTPPLSDVSGGQNGGGDTAPVAAGGSSASSATPAPPDPVGATSPQAEAPTANPMVAPQAAAESSISRTEFGIDLGAAGNSDGLRALWSTVRAQHGALLEGLHPMGVMRETGKPGGAELRLVAGPLLNAAAAARLCAVLTGTGRTCQPSIFDSQRQALR